MLLHGLLTLEMVPLSSNRFVFLNTKAFTPLILFLLYRYLCLNQTDRMKYLEGIPETLYKYRSWDSKYHQSLLTENEIFLASPANLNDPFDASLPFRYDQAEMTPENVFRKLVEIGKINWPEKTDAELHEIAYKRQNSGVFESGDYWKEQHAESKASMHKTFGILSTTTKNDNLLMWAHYADCHRGFCVGLDSKILFESIGGTIGRVNYADSFPMMPLFGQNSHHMVKMLNTKSPEWEYEDEYRVTKGNASNVAFTLPPEAITEVVLGCNMPADQRKEIIGVLDEKLPHVKIFDATTSLEHFRLDINIAVKIS